jgi:hypothetical protein
MGIRILLALDGSADSDRGLDLAVAARWPAGSRVEVLGVQDGTLPFFGVDEPPSLLAGGDERRAIEERSREIARRDLAAAADRLSREGHDSGWDLLAGDRLSTILTEIGHKQIDLCIVGSSREEAADDLGTSLAERLMEAAPAPILAARRPLLGPLLAVVHSPGVAEAVVETLVRWDLPGLRDGLLVLAAAEADLPEPIEAAVGWVPEADHERQAIEDEAAARRQAALAGAAAVLDRAGIRAELVDAGPVDPADAVLEVAARRAVNTIVTPIGRRIEAEPPLSDRQREANRIGAELLRRAPCSVLAIPVDRGAELSQAAHQ